MNKESVATNFRTVRSFVDLICSCAESSDNSAFLDTENGDLSVTSSAKVVKARN